MSLPDGYEPKQDFWTAQQRECFVKLLPHARTALFMEPRCGKSKPIVDKACFYYERPSHPLHITGVLVIAFPNGVHHGWIKDAFPENVPARLPWAGVVWNSQKAKTKESRAAFADLIAFRGLAVLAVNVEATSSDTACRAIDIFLRKRGRVFVVYDESSCLAHSNAERSRVAHSIGRRPEVIMKAILDGTPVDKNGPMDYFSQIGWMGRDLLGCETETEFRNRHAEIVTRGGKIFWGKVASITKELANTSLGAKLPREERLALIRDVAVRRAKGEVVVDEKGVKRPIKKGRDWWTEVAKGDDGLPKFRNMDELWKKLDPITYRATFAQCFPGSPRPVYQKRRFELTDEQRRVYDDIDEQFAATLRDGHEINAEHALTRQLRLQQVTSNYYPEQTKIELHAACDGNGCEACDYTGAIESIEPLRLIDHNRNPRLEALAEEIRSGKPVVIWARFRPDVDAVFALCDQLGLNPCRYDGSVSDEGKVDSKEGFQSGKYGAIVGNQVSMSRGIPLYRAELMVGYSNLFSFRTRRQVEERSEHGSKKFATQLVDLVANDTVDDLSIIPALRAGMDVSTFILRDQKREWI